MNKKEPTFSGMEQVRSSIETGEPAVLDTIRLLDAFLPQPRRFDIRLWNGEVLPGGAAAGSKQTFRMVLNHPGALRSMVKPPLELSLGEAYIHGDFDLEGDLLDAISLMEDFFGQAPDFSKIAGLVPLWLKLPPRRQDAAVQQDRGPARLNGKKHSIERDREAIRYHYDVSNEFYALWLGKRMLYSCAYFKSVDDDIDTSQENKLEHVCRKIMLKPGDHLLDIGCGWGGLAIYAAEKYQARVTGITLSRKQYQYACERVAQAGLTDRIDIRLQDYREIADATFDKIASIGMVEHVGREKLPDYFSQAYRLLKPGGLFLNHGISSRLEPVYRAQNVDSEGLVGAREVRPGWWERWLNRNILGPGSFQQKYFFPDGELEAVSDLNLVAEKTGFEVRDVENLREHYALTLEHWVKKMEEMSEEMIRQTNLTIYRTWRLYMAGSAFGFRTGRSSIHQSLLVKPDHGISGLPLTREWIYKR